ncbi:MAG: glycerol kinase, partial [Desulfobacteraceae bacterium]|nr:glycerol kinase [Desulfobacteraceae bacterium]
VFRPKISETTVLGAAFAAGLATGFWDTTDELKSNWTLERKWDPEMSDKKRNELYNGWLKAVKRTYDWL